MVNTFHRLGHVRLGFDNFNVKDSAHSGRPQKCEDEQLQVLLDDDPTQTQQQLAEALNVTQGNHQQTFTGNGENP